ncbi:hypothetical protein SAMN02746041_02034 [Desulfacinum hydrothermale DSM 13146]|uniref:Uncharacterized protein n=1 Tax=Desulfacinum hydrothermale DSM 13146 TaxID=1121390 RepID=A0A1W1XLZ5_9BACT|nr:hypothetical protein [Desulfacinum hydrothermale]SMC24548.1 hypothetical protein SAMN02746041_02034 [Desulfacinum hydrothermale DSM 13146]
MTLKALAAELYKSIRRVEELEKKVAEMPPHDPARAQLERELAQARQERDRLKGALDGAKA